MADPNSIILVDGQQEFSAGVDSSRVSTMASELVPHGMPRNGLCWLWNGVVRDGGITCRDGWTQLIAELFDGAGLMQGGFLYEPEGDYPYLVVLVAGHLYKVDLTALTKTELVNAGPYTLTNPQYNPATVEHAFFCQAERFLIVQAGDYTTLPLFWDGTTLRRSKGITNTGVAPGTPGINEIPAAGPMEYYMQRVWYAQYRTYSAGDIVGGNSGTLAYGFEDAILNVTENPLAAGGDGFRVPAKAGNIRALKAGNALDEPLGQKSLYIFTRKQVYSAEIPITRKDWIDASSNNYPRQKIVRFANGAVNDRSIVAINSDYFYQSLEPSICSLISAVRYFQQWGNTPIAANVDRIMRFNDRSILTAVCGMEFRNRLWQTALPKRTAAGIAHSAIVPLDFFPITSFRRATDSDPAYEGHYDALDVLQMWSGDFGGLQRAFALTVSRVNSAVDLWEFTGGERVDTTTTDDRRITWMAEFPAYTFMLPHRLKDVKGGEVWLDRAYGTVTVQVWYRSDADPCWIYWHRHEFCAARTTCEDVDNPICYPETGYAEGYKWPIVLPAPPKRCDAMHVRPSDRCYQVQLRVMVTGFARLRSVFVYGVEVPRGLYQGLTTQNTPPNPQALPLTV